MNELDPEVLFNRIANDVSPRLHAHVFVTGSLAAAYSFRTRLEGRAVNTKDADLVVHPAGDVVSCQELATELLTPNGRVRMNALLNRRPNPPTSYERSGCSRQNLGTTSSSSSGCPKWISWKPSGGFPCNSLTAGTDFHVFGLWDSPCMAGCGRRVGWSTRLRR